MTIDEARNILEQRIDFLKHRYPIITSGWKDKQIEASMIALVAINLLVASLKEGGYTVEYEDGFFKIDIGGKDYEI